MPVVVPGDLVDLSSLKAGPGIDVWHDRPRAQSAGYLSTSRGVSFVDSNTKRYIPSRGDLVIGVIQGRIMTDHRVSLQPFSRSVRLGELAFENATRKNKPKLVQGDVVYARVASADPALDPELECFDATTGKAAGFGQLQEGMLIEVGLGFARHLISEGHPVLDAIGKKYPYEVAIGVNGRIWIKGPDLQTTWRICQWIQKAEFTPQGQSEKLR